MEEITEKKITESVQPDMVKCSYCASNMSTAAVVCPQCRFHKKSWRNHLRVDHIGLLLALCMIIIAYFNFREAREERRLATKEHKEATEALQRAMKVEATVEEVRSKVGILHQEIALAKENVAKVQAYFESAKIGTEEIAKTLAYVRTVHDQLLVAQRKIESLDARVSKAPPPPPKPSLSIDQVKSVPVDSGLRGEFHFKSAGDASLTSVQFKIAVVQGAATRITSIRPTMPISLMVSSSVSPDGKEALLSYTVVGNGPPGFSVDMTGPGKVRIEGTPGITPFEVSVK